MAALLLRVAAVVCGSLHLSSADHSVTLFPTRGCASPRVSFAVYSKSGKPRGTMSVSELLAKTVAVGGDDDGHTHTHSHSHSQGGQGTAALGATGGEHSVQRRVCKACWSQPAKGGITGPDTTLSSAAVLLAKQYEAQVTARVL